MNQAHIDDILEFFLIYEIFERAHQIELGADYEHPNVNSFINYLVSQTLVFLNLCHLRKVSENYLVLESRRRERAIFILEFLVSLVLFESPSIFCLLVNFITYLVKDYF